MLIYPYKKGFDVLKFENLLYFSNKLKLTEKKTNIFLLLI